MAKDRSESPVEIQIPVLASTGSAPYFHSHDYSKLVGVLFLHEPSKTWRVKYSESESADEFGGTVTLSGTVNGPSQLRSGMLVSVNGQVKNHESGTASPEYVAHEIQVLAP